jgi:Xaa-Pro aminopeptidase
MLMQLEADFFVGNRRALIEKLPDNAVVVLTAHRLMQERRDSIYPFVQEANFYYLTGIEEPDWKLVIDCRKKTSWLISPRLNQTTIVFDGMLSAADAKRKSGVDRVVKVSTSTTFLRDLAKTGRPVYTLFQQTALGRMEHMALNPSLRLVNRQLRGYGLTPLDCRAELSRLRAIKQPVEIKALQAALNLTGETLIKLFAKDRGFTNECEYEAFLTYEFRRQGSQGHAFSPIVAGGARACTMHYQANNQRVYKKDWLQFDIGARVAGYAADLSRPVPLNRHPSSYEQAVFQAIESVHDQAIAICQPGVPLLDYMYESDRFMMQALKDLGLLQRRTNRGLRKYYNHAIGHGLGLDAHDPLGGFETFQEGMVLTVEPGIYDNERGLGMRIENVFTITKQGPKLLSAHIPNRLW